MGSNKSEVAKRLLALVPAAVHAPKTSPAAGAWHEQAAHVVDLLTHWGTLNRSVDTKEVNPVTGKAIKAEVPYTLTDIKQHAWRWVNFPNALETIVLVDDRDCVPKQKAKEQARRKEAAEVTRENQGQARKAVPYPTGSVLVPSGVRYTRQVQASAGAPPEEQVVFEPLYMTRIQASRNTVGGKVLWEELCRSLFEKQREAMYPSKRLRVVLRKDCAMEVLGKTDTLRVGASTCESHGEGEVAMFHELWLLERGGITGARPIPLHVHLHSDDSDVLALYLFYHLKRTKEQKLRTEVWWRRNADQVVNLGAFTEGLVAHVHGLGFTWVNCMQIAEAMLLCGNDYIKKKHLTDGHGPDPIFNAYFAACKWFVAPSLDKLRLFLRFLWGKPAVVAARGARTTKAKALVPPTPLTAATLLTLEQIRAREALKPPPKPRGKAAKAAEEAKKRKEEEAAQRALSSIEEEPLPLPEDEDEEEQEPAIKFPTDQVILEQTSLWMWNCDYYDGAFAGKRPDQAAIHARLLQQVQEEKVVRMAVTGQKRKQTPESDEEEEEAYEVQEDKRRKRVVWID